MNRTIARVPVRTISVSSVLTAIVALGIIFIGLRELVHPVAGAAGFGVPLVARGDSDLLAIKAARDLASGFVLLALLGLRVRRPLAYVLGALTLIPIMDGVIVLAHAGWRFEPVILVHWGTAALMWITVALLRKGK